MPGPGYLTASASKIIVFIVVCWLVPNSPGLRGWTHHFLLTSMFINRAAATHVYIGQLKGLVQKIPFPGRTVVRAECIRLSFNCQVRLGSSLLHSNNAKATWPFTLAYSPNYSQANPKLTVNAKLGPRWLSDINYTLFATVQSLLLPPFKSTWTFPPKW